MVSCKEANHSSILDLFADLRGVSLAPLLDYARCVGGHRRSDARRTLKLEGGRWELVEQVLCRLGNRSGRFISRPCARKRPVQAS